MGYKLDPNAMYRMPIHFGTEDRTEIWDPMAENLSVKITRNQHQFQ